MKDIRLLKLANSIKLNEDFTKYLENAELKEVLLNKKTNKMTIVILNDFLFPIEMFHELYQKGTSLDGVDKIRYKFIIKDNDKYFKEYFLYYFDILVKSCPMLECVKKDKMVFDNNTVDIEVLNTAEKNKIEELVDKMEVFLSDMGFDDISIKATINEKEREKFRESLAEVRDEVKSKKTRTTIKGSPIVGEASQIKNLIAAEDKVVLIAKVFGIDSKSTQSGWFIITLKITDYTDSIIANIFTKKQEEFDYLLSNIKKDKWYKFKGTIKYNTRSNDYEFDINDIETYEKTVDDAPIKRVELHAHTMMSQMDGLTRLDLGAHTCELVSRTIDMGYRGVAITDHNGCQAFPIAYQIIKGYNKGVKKKVKENLDALKEKLNDEMSESEKAELNAEIAKAEEVVSNPPIFKGLYGTELTLVDDTVKIVVKGTDLPLEGTEFVVYDTETTGFNAANGDQMIEIGAVKIKDGVITDRFDKFINPGRHIPDKITELTFITDEMVKDASDEGTVTKEFLDWVKDAPMVAHNAKFDISFIEMAMKKYDLGEFKNTVIDTLELSRALDQGFARHSLSALVKRYNVPFDEESHHRADYDA